MTRLIIAFLTLSMFAGAAIAEDAGNCDVPGYLLFGDTALNRAGAAVKNQKRLNIAVFGTASSIVSGGGNNKAYPARLEARLQSRLPGVAVEVKAIIRPRQTVAEMAGGLDSLLKEAKPDLVIWQAGTVDAMRGVETDTFRNELQDGVETLQNGGADVVLMNMQYSPRTESIIALSAYADNMRVVARDRDAPLFDRLAIMRHWSDTGVFDLYAATKNPAMAERVHDCIGRALASMIIDAAQLGAVEAKAPQ
jgi:hypothetical protein